MATDIDEGAVACAIANGVEAYRGDLFAPLPIELGPADVVVADPARTGLGRPGVDALVACGAPRLVLVSCDPASLGRDVALLATAGYRLRRVAIVDSFAQTSHVEAVSVLDR